MGADVVTATVAADAIAVAGTLAQVPNQGGGHVLKSWNV